MAEPDLPDIVVDKEIDDEGGQFLEEFLSIGSKPSYLKERIYGDEDLSTVDIPDPTTVTSGLSFEVTPVGMVISKTHYDQRQIAKCLTYTASFNLPDSDRFMSLRDGVNHAEGTFQDMTYDDILVKICEYSQRFPGHEIRYNSSSSPTAILGVFAGEFKFDNTDVVSAFTKVVERAGNYSWWLPNNPAGAATAHFSDTVEILDLGDPAVVPDVAKIGDNVYHGNWAGGGPCPTSVLVTDKDGRGSKLQFGVPRDAGREERPDELLNSLPPLVGGPIDATHVSPRFVFDYYDIRPEDIGNNLHSGWVFTAGPQGNFANDEMELSFNLASPEYSIGGFEVAPVFSAPAVGNWPNAEPPIGGIGAPGGQTSHTEDFVQIGRKLNTPQR